METNMEIDIEQGWAIISKEISKLINILQGVPDESPRYDLIYSTVYALCTKKSFPEIFPNYEFEVLYRRYKDVYTEYLIYKVLPSILEKQHDDDDDVSMLQELVKRWENHKFMVTNLVRYFDFMDRHYLRLSQRPSLKDVGFGCFHEIVYDKMKLKVKDAVIALVNRERQGNEIDTSLVKDVVDIFVQIGGSDDKLDCYVNDFETAFLTDLVDYYNEKGFNDITPAECFRMEKDRVSRYLHSSTEDKLFPKPVQRQRRVLPEISQEDLDNKRICRVKVIGVNSLSRIR
ncbi:hypothetical protein MKX03_001246 [Papaver bracteatum]|nr:hypothetical protein MKX03_001246 [Papaver bracteatum]